MYIEYPHIPYAIHWCTARHSKHTQCHVLHPDTHSHTLVCVRSNWNFHIATKANNINATSIKHGSKLTNWFCSLIDILNFCIEIYTMNKREWEKKKKSNRKHTMPFHSIEFFPFFIVNFFFMACSFRQQKKNTSQIFAGAWINCVNLHIIVISFFWVCLPALDCFFFRFAIPILVAEFN